MASGLSQVAIYNRVLDLLDEEVVISPSDDRAPARWLNRNYAIVRDLLLQNGLWKFALRRAALASLNAAPAFEWRYVYDLPSDCIRLIPPTAGGYLDGAPVGYALEGGQILTNATAPFNVRYVARVENPASFDPLFAEALATKLAEDMSMWMTGKNSYTERMMLKHRDAMQSARSVDALLSPPAMPLMTDFIMARD